MTSYTVTTKVNNPNYDCSADFTNTAFDKAVEYIIRVNNTKYEAISGATGRLVYGGADDEGSVDGDDDSAVIAAVLAAVTSGVVLLNGVAFDLTQFGDIPENVRVVCNYGAEYWEYINSADSSGSPYTVSVGSGVNVGYYLAQDRQGRICWSSTNGATVTQAVHDAMSTDGGTVNVKGRINIPSTLTFSKPIVWVGDGSGLIWNGFDVHASAFVWTGTTNHVPMIKLLGTLAQSPEKDVAQKFENIAFLYDSSSTGTDAIYLDGENSCVRHIIFDAVNIIGFTGSGVHAKGSVFDIQNNNIGIVGCDLDAYKIEEGTGIPSQFYFFGCMLQSKKTGTYALHSEASRTVVSGGTITCAEAGSNGAYIRKSGALYGVNIEGTAKAGSIGVTYTGTGLEITGCSIISWATGLKIGIATSAWASNWYVDAGFGSNTVTDVEITKGGNRIGVLGYTSDKTISSITNTRLSDNGVPDVLRLKQTQQSPIAIVVGASAYTYKNRDDCMEDVIISGGNVTSIEWADFLGNYYDLGQTSGAFTLAPGEYLRVTYTDAPTMVKVYR